MTAALTAAILLSSDITVCCCPGKVAVMAAAPAAPGGSGGGGTVMTVVLALLVTKNTLGWSGAHEVEAMDDDEEDEDEGFVEMEPPCMEAIPIVSEEEERRALVGRSVAMASCEPLLSFTIDDDDDFKDGNVQAAVFAAVDVGLLSIILTTTPPSLLRAFVLVLVDSDAAVAAGLVGREQPSLANILVSLPSDEADVEAEAFIGVILLASESLSANTCSRILRFSIREGSCLSSASSCRGSHHE